MDSVVGTLATLSIDFDHHPDRVDHAISTALHESLNWRAAVYQTLPHLQDDEQGSVISANFQQPAITPAIALKSLLFQISNNRIRVRQTLLAQNMMILIHGLRREIPKDMTYVVRSTDSTSAAIKEMFFTIAVRFGQSSLVAAFLATGTNPDGLIDHNIDFKIDVRRGKAGLNRESMIRPVTPLQLAAASCDIEMARTLLQYGAKPNFGNPTPLQLVCSLPPKFGAVRLAQLLLEHRASLNTIGNDTLLPPLLEAVASGNVKMVQCLLGEGAVDRVVTIAPPERRSLSNPQLLSTNLPSIYVSQIPSEFPNHPRYAEAVWHRNEENITALQIAIIIDDKRITQMLISALRDHEDRANIYKWTLITACLAADEDMVHQSLGAITDMRDDKIWLNSALCAAAWISDCRIARQLLKLGAIPEQQAETAISALQTAAMYGNVDLIKLLHSSGLDINAPDIELESNGMRNDQTKPPKYCRPLECAIRVGHVQAVRVLLQLGAGVTGSTVALAITYGNDDMTLVLLARGANVNAKLGGALPLEIAIEKRKGLTLITKLVAFGAEISTRALITAMRNNDRAVSKYLLDSEVDIPTTPRRTMETVTDAATQMETLEIIKRYFACGGHYSSNALLLAAETSVLVSDYSMFEYLCQQRPAGPMDVYENTLFVQPILNYNHNLVKLFLSHGIGSAMSHYCWHWDERNSWKGPKLSHLMKRKVMNSDPEEVGRQCFRQNCSCKITPLWAAAHIQQKPLVEHLISANHPPDAFLLESALYDPKFSSFEIRQQLINAYPLSSIRDKRSCRRILMAAIRWNAGYELFQQHINSLRSLDFILNGYIDDYYRTPLQLAAKCGNIEHTRQLLDAQANINEPAAGDHGQTALQVAVDQENFDLTMFLLERGADINAPGARSSGNTALQLAVSRGNLKMVTLLLDHGADANGPPSVYGGKTAIEESARRGLTDMVALLLPHTCFHGHMRLHFVRAVVSAEHCCHYATAKFLKHGRWTEKDRALSITPQATESLHTCPRFIYNEQSWEGKCLMCGDDESSIRSDSSSSSKEEKTTHSVVDLTEFADPATNAGAMVLSDDLALPEDQSETLHIDQLAELTDLSFDAPDTTTRWLDDLVLDYFESFDGTWQET